MFDIAKGDFFEFFHPDYRGIYYACDVQESVEESRVAGEVELRKTVYVYLLDPKGQTSTWAYHERYRHTMMGLRTL